MKSTNKLIEKKRSVIGSIIEICIDDKYYTYAQKLANDAGSLIFFDYYDTSRIEDSRIFNTLNKLFIITIYDSAFKRPNWKIFNKIEIREEFKILPLEFIYDKIVDQYRIYDPNTGEIRKSNREEIIGLEMCAVWPGNCIEDRIRDHYEGKVCIWVKSMYGEIFENFQELYG